MEMNDAEIRGKVVRALCISLAIEPAGISSNARLIDDLGMDSLDFLDVMFSLEADFGIRIRDAEFDRILRPDRSEAVWAGEFLSGEEIDKLSTVIPALRAQGGQVPRRTLFTFITVDTLVGLIRRRLNQS